MDSIIVLADVIVPNRLIEASGLRGRQIRGNDRGMLLTGKMSVNVRQTRTRREWEWGTVPLIRQGWQDLEALFEVTDAGAYGCLMEDPKDSSVDQAHGVVVGLTSTTFQLHQRKVHAGSSRYHDRKLTRPLAATVAMFVDGAPTAFTLDATTGIATIAGGIAASRITWSGRFYVPVHFQSDVIDWELVAGHADPDARYLAGPSVVFEEILE